MFRLCRADGSLVEDATELWRMFSDHFQTIFSSCPLFDGVLATREACRRVVPRKVSSGDRDILEQSLTHK